MSYPKPPSNTRKPPQVSGQVLLMRILRSSPDDYALFLDIDGTLLDLAETPDGIVVPAALPSQLDLLSRKLGGALALVTGRALAYADQLFTPYRFPIAGLHGAELRAPDGRVEAARSTPAFERLKADLNEATRHLDGVLIEDKGPAVAAHYRLAPESQAELEPLMETFLARAGDNWTLQRGKMVLEIRPASADKGQAVEALLSRAPFAGRSPITIGDDITDEAMFHAANRRGGHSIRIGTPLAATAATATLPNSAALRELIAQITV
ncbi:trehalose-phosphatase [Rhizobium sp. AC44/96]|nr:trehalose-phosphatase [Rhizobium sp. AC44/96]